MKHQKIIIQNKRLALSDNQDFANFAYKKNIERYSNQAFAAHGTEVVMSLTTIGPIFLSI